MNSKITKKINSDEILQEIINNFENEIYLVGGAVRDFLTGKSTNDRDLLILDEDAREFSLKVSEHFNATFVPLDEVNKIYRIVMPDKINYLDITNPLENSLEKDLKRRDLTINAVAVNIRTAEIVDVTGGCLDLENKIIKAISGKNFEDDPLRLLRVFRFQAQTGFCIDPETFAAVKKHSDLISKPAVERINYEIMHLFSGNFSSEALIKMDEAGLLEKIFPVINELKQVTPNTHHHLRLFEHCLETSKRIGEIYKTSSDEVKEHLERVDFGGYSRLAHLKLAGFLHDIGKFSTWTIEEDTGRHRFIKHDDVGAKMVCGILKKLAFSNKQIEYISSMIKNHIYPSSVMCSPVINDKVMMRYVRKMDTNSIDAIILAQADRLSARGPAVTDEMVEKNLSSLNRLLKFYLDVRDTLEPLPKLLDGNDVMRILDIKPSKKLGEIMTALHEAQINGDVLTVEHAVDFVKSLS